MRPMFHSLAVSACSSKHFWAKLLPTAYAYACEKNKKETVPAEVKERENYISSKSFFLSP